MYSMKAEQFCKFSYIDLSIIVTVKSIVEISQNCAAFSELYYKMTQVKLVQKQ